MSFPNPRYDPSRRRRRHRQAPGASHHSPLTTIATTAAVAYGAYRIGSYLWNSYFGDDDYEEDDGKVNENEDGSEDLLYEWTSGYQSKNRDIRTGRQGSGYDLDDYIGEVDQSSSNDDNGEDNTSSNNNDARMMRGQRRSRVDWSNEHKERSHRPSPPQDYHHHHHNSSRIEEGGDENTEGDGMMKQGIKKAAAIASNGIGTAVTAGISAGIQAYNRNSVATNSIPEQERKVRMGRCRLETSRAMMDFLPTLKKAITKETDVSLETEELKRLRVRKKELLQMQQNGENGGNISEDVNDEVNDEEDVIREKERCLWNDIKNKSLTRLITTVYAHTIIFLVLNVQVSLLGGQLLREELSEKESDQQPSNTFSSSADRYRTSHQIVLAKTYHYLFAKGIPDLAKSVRKEVEEILGKWDVLGDDATLRDVTLWIETIRDKMEQRNRKEMEMSQLVKFVIPPEGELDDSSHNDTSDDELAKYILDETYDLLESPTFANAEHQCLDTTFEQLQMKVLVKWFLLEDRIPLANVVTQLQKTAVSTFHKPPSHKEEMKSWGGVLGMMEEPLPSVPNDYISRLERLNTVQELSDVCF